eukprot:gnl/TRDRNA2_/TRDRNA2_159576_c0_seq2.p1 gnl/TRDRNA2_/TRDRNA2_159576_c0~~gnl/TRDRNA2_/TRDRNA2_159576_c0_seq2.p1  ORF type:complete len:243 (+),score=26.32 gnl/TRDRNA2_/TRDRNA2_159576_c0_seq2:57-785(+)
MSAGGWRPGDWECPSCGNHNYASKVGCNRCGQPKPAGGAYGKAEMGKGAPRASPYVSWSGEATNGVSIGAMRPGDWCCSQCGNHNYANRTHCNKCNAPAMVGMMLGGGMMGSGMKGGGGGMWSGGGTWGSGGAWGGMRQGDWTCHSCGNINYQNRESCNKCGIPKTAFISKSGMRAGDWLCPTCQNHNYADKAACNKCGTPKGQTPVHTANMREGDWLCPTCNNHNYKDKAVCNKCQAPKAR